jgi:succinoglycan biosynthesis protein ExoL
MLRCNMSWASFPLGGYQKRVMLNILYLVHDLSDPAVRRRVMMLRAGGATVTVAGFRRGETYSREIDGMPAIDLGVTRDGAFGHRLLAVARAAANVRSSLSEIPRPDLILTRNLEMLVLAKRARSALGGDNVPVVYECLDIHRLMLRDDVVGKALRSAERYLAADVKLLVTSSPAFLENYFRRHRQVDAPAALVENKFFDPDGASEDTSARPVGPPWRIGWFGALRCRRSLELLAAFTRHAQGRFEVVLRGRPALSEFTDFHGFVAAEPYISFGGAYRNPEDMSDVYGRVHFSWVIDFFEEGQNSSWLLPNRLYEGCRFGAVPIAVAGTETARFLEKHGIGITLPAQPSVTALTEALGAIDAEAVARLQDAILAKSPATWTCDRSDCRHFVENLARIAFGSERLAPPRSVLAVESKT